MLSVACDPREVRVKRVPVRKAELGLLARILLPEDHRVVNLCSRDETCMVSDQKDVLTRV